MTEFRMPSLGADMEAGTLVEWLIKPGDAVKRGQVVAVVETQKGAIEVEIWEDGVVDRLVAQPGAKIPVGEVLALLRGQGAPAPAAPAAQAPELAAATVAAPPPPARVSPHRPVSRSRRRACRPPCRRRATA